MKNTIAMLLILVFLLSGCGSTKSASKLASDSDASTANSNTTSSASTTTENTNESTCNATQSNTVETTDQVSDANYDQSDIDVDITEKMYVTYINEIYLNAEDYMDQTIRIQGMFQAYKDDTNGQTYYYVYRTGPGCCGNDGSMCGFEFTWNGEIPKDNDWIEVVGSLGSYDEDGWTYLTLDAKSVTVMDERGAETVYQ